MYTYQYSYLRIVLTIQTRFYNILFASYLIHITHVMNIVHVLHTIYNIHTLH